MKKHIAVALLLSCLGIVCLVLSEVEFKSQEELFRVGDFRATAPSRKTLPAFRYAGVAALSGGVILFIASWRQRRSF